MFSLGRHQANGRGHSSAGRASRLQREGRRFDPDWLHQNNQLNQRVMSHAQMLVHDSWHAGRRKAVRMGSLKIRQFVLTLKRRCISIYE